MRSSNHLVLIVHCKNEFEKWRAIRACVGGVLAWVAYLHGWRGWRAIRACVGGMLAWVTWMACLRGWCASVGGVLAWVAC